MIDATGKFVFPGFIDPHVHIYLPFMGTFAKDTYDTASRAALVGGTTTLIEMCCPAAQRRSAGGVRAVAVEGRARARATTRFTWACRGSTPRRPTAIREIVGRGIASFKVFLAYKGAFGIDDGELFNTLALAKELGVIVTAHCENETLVAELQRRLLAEGKTGPEWHEPSRPPRVEAEGVHHLMTFAELTGAHVYCVHTSCREALEAVQAARLRGVQVWVETVIPYLVLDKTYAEKPDFEGAKYVMSPPLRDKSHQPALWNALRSRLISTVATDHAPFDFNGQKEMGRGDFTKIPNGIPSVEDRVNLLYTHGVCTRADRPAHVRRRRQHAGGEAVRPVPAQGHDRRRAATPTSWSTTRSTAARFREDAADEGRLQRVRRLGDRRPAERGHGPRQGAGARRQVRRASWARGKFLTRAATHF